MKRILLALLCAASLHAAEFTGQAFLTNSLVKFSGMKVMIYPPAAADEVNKWNPEMPAPLAETTTDGDGRFKFTLPDDASFFLYAKTTLRARNGRVTDFVWAIKSDDIKDRAAIVLTEANCQPTHQIVNR